MICRWKFQICSWKCKAVKKYLGRGWLGINKMMANAWGCHFISTHGFEFWFLKVTVITFMWELLAVQNSGGFSTTAEPESAFSQVPQVIFRHFKVGEALGLNTLLVVVMTTCSLAFQLNCFIFHPVQLLFAQWSVSHSVTWQTEPKFSRGGP